MQKVHDDYEANHKEWEKQVILTRGRAALGWSHYNSPYNKCSATAEEVAAAFKDFQRCDFNLKHPDILKTTLKIYNNINSALYREMRVNKERGTRAVVCMFGKQLDDILAEFGIGKGYNNSYRVKNANKFFLYVYDNIIEPKIKELGIKGLKLKNRSRITPYSYELFDFSNVEFNTDSVESN